MTLSPTAKNDTAAILRSQPYHIIQNMSRKGNCMDNGSADDMPSKVGQTFGDAYFHVKEKKN